MGQAISRPIDRGPIVGQSLEKTATRYNDGSRAARRGSIDSSGAFFMAKARVAVLKTKPETVLEDTGRTMELADVKRHLAAGATTILKDNISWHFPFPGANTTPWQMEGTILALQKAGFPDISAVQNKTVVTNAFKGEDLNNYVPLFKKYKIPVLYNFKDEDMT